eukprot:m.99842 g.99842  ORF g.99842 m.99842 type:complete len:95 (-) comp27195_c0_seq1:214-498(-)
MANAPSLLELIRNTSSCDLPISISPGSRTTIPSENKRNPVVLKEPYFKADAPQGGGVDALAPMFALPLQSKHWFLVFELDLKVLIRPLPSIQTT